MLGNITTGLTSRSLHALNPSCHLKDHFLRQKGTTISRPHPCRMLRPTQKWHHLFPNFFLCHLARPLYNTLTLEKTSTYIALLVTFLFTQFQPWRTYTYVYMLGGIHLVWGVLRVQCQSGQEMDGGLVNDIWAARTLLDAVVPRSKTKFYTV
jgi:hypothetical protein